MNKITVTIDFDNTLSRRDVQEYALELIGRGVDVWVLTSRYDVIHQHKYQANPTNDDLWEVVDRVGIPRWKVRFQCMRPKDEYLFGSNVLWHLDDDSIELNGINIETKTVGISVLSGGWRQKCEKLIQKKCLVDIIESDEKLGLYENI